MLFSFCIIHIFGVKVAKYFPIFTKIACILSFMCQENIGKHIQWRNQFMKLDWKHGHKYLKANDLGNFGAIQKDHKKKSHVNRHWLERNLNMLEWVIYCIMSDAFVYSFILILLRVFLTIYNKYIYGESASSFLLKWSCLWERWFNL